MNSSHSQNRSRSVFCCAHSCPVATIVALGTWNKTQPVERNPSISTQTEVTWLFAAGFELGTGKCSKANPCSPNSGKTTPTALRLESALLRLPGTHRLFRAPTAPLSSGWLAFCGWAESLRTTLKPWESILGWYVLVFIYRGIDTFPAFLGGAKWISSIHSTTLCGNRCEELDLQSYTCQCAKEATCLHNAGFPFGFAQKPPQRSTDYIFENNLHLEDGVTSRIWGWLKVQLGQTAGSSPCSHLPFGACLGIPQILPVSVSPSDQNPAVRLMEPLARKVQTKTHCLDHNWVLHSVSFLCDR